MTTLAQTQMMHGLFGLSDELWSLVVQLFGMLLAFVVGWCTRTKSFPSFGLVILGVAVDFIAQLVIAGGGPGFFVGLVVLPIYFLVAAWIGRAIAWAVNRKLNRI